MAKLSLINLSEQFTFNVYMTFSVMIINGNLQNDHIELVIFARNNVDRTTLAFKVTAADVSTR